MRIEGDYNAAYSGVNGSTSGDPVSKQLKKQIQEVKKQLQELSADQSVPMEEKAEEQKELTKKLNDLNNQLRQHELDKQEEQRRKAAEKRQERLEASGTAKEEKADGDAAGFDRKTVQAMAAAETGQAVTVKKEGVRMDLSHEALALNIGIKRQEQWEGGVSPLRAVLNELYGDMGRLTGETLEGLREAEGALEQAAGKRTEEKDRDGQDGKEKSSVRTDGEEDAADGQ